MFSRCGTAFGVSKAGGAARQSRRIAAALDYQKRVEAAIQTVQALCDGGGESQDCVSGRWLMRRLFDIACEPRGEVLRRLICSLAEYTSSVVMVVQESLGLGEVGQALLSRLEPYLLEQKLSSHWPGTTLFERQATVFRFEASDQVFEELAAISDGLYEWQQPHLPEDLAFIREDGTAILASICHERDAYLEISDEEYRRLILSVPYFHEIIDPAAGHPV